MPGQTGQSQRSGSDAPVLASDSVRFVGEPIALVAAESLDIAERALQLIEIEYEKTPGVFDPMDALRPGAPIVNAPDNVVARWKIRRGDCVAGFEMADRVIENTYRVPFVDHAYIEPEAGVGWVDERQVIKPPRLDPGSSNIFGPSRAPWASRRTRFASKGRWSAEAGRRQNLPRRSPATPG